MIMGDLSLCKTSHYIKPLTAAINCSLFGSHQVALYSFYLVRLWPKKCSMQYSLIPLLMAWDAIPSEKCGTKPTWPYLSHYRSKKQKSRLYHVHEECWKVLVARAGRGSTTAWKSLVAQHLQLFCITSIADTASHLCSKHVLNKRNS